MVSDGNVPVNGYGAVKTRTKTCYDERCDKGMRFMLAMDKPAFNRENSFLALFFKKTLISNKNIK